MATSLFYDHHVNQLVLRSPWQPFASTLAIAFHAPSLYCSLSDSEPGDAGGRTADERLHQTLLRSLQKMPESRRQLCRALDTLACFGRWRTLTIYLGISLCDGRLDVVLICHRFGQIWNRSAADVRLPLLADSAPLSALSPSPPSSTPSSTLNYKPILAHSRTTTEQRSRMDALEQGNFAAEHAAVALAAVKKNCSVSDKDVVKTRAGT